jgi:thiamine pyrophosphokinase
MTKSWSPLAKTDKPRALIILNQPFSLALLDRLWSSSHWKCCADGGANRLHDLLRATPAPAGVGRPAVGTDRRAS